MLVAFYKAVHPGWRGVWDRAVKLITGSPYTHCELIFASGVSYSASWQDGGCRWTRIDFNPDHWDFLQINVVETEVVLFCTREQGRAYDVPGVFRFLLPFLKESPTRWFCSEICVAALQSAGALPEKLKAWRITPGRLYKLLTPEGNA